MQVSKTIAIIISTLLFISCEQNEQKLTIKDQPKLKIGVLVVSHGSHSTKWREMVSKVADSVRSDILSNPNISEVKHAFMEYTEPSIASRMKEFDKAGYTDVIVVPLLLTVSGHSFDDIPHIMGLKNVESELEKLKQEGIEVYQAKANIKIAPLLDFPKILGDNLVNRISKISTNPQEEGCVLVAYGDRSYNEEWIKLMTDMGEEIKEKVGINLYYYSWCGHIVDYNTKPTTKAIEKILEQKERALVIPVLVAVDEMFQNDIIGGAVEKVKKKNAVIYKPDAILPDEQIDNWIINISNKLTNEIISGA